VNPRDLSWFREGHRLDLVGGHVQVLASRDCGRGVAVKVVKII
jgi:hypothetical protein